MESKTPFYNEDRRRYYGVRVGDYVRLIDKELLAAEPHIRVEGYVTEWGFLDNNRVGVTPKGGGRVVPCVAEWLTILIPVETWSLVSPAVRSLPLTLSISQRPARKVSTLMAGTSSPSLSPPPSSI